MPAVKPLSEFLLFILNFDNQIAWYEGWTKPEDFSGYFNEYGCEEGKASPCTLLSQKQIDDKMAQITSAQNLAFYAFFLGNETTAGKPDMRTTRSYLALGEPLDGYSKQPVQQDLQQKYHFDFFWWSLEQTLYDYYGLAGDDKAAPEPFALNSEKGVVVDGGMKVMWWGFGMQNLEFIRTSYVDMAWVGGSILFVFS